VFLQLGYNFQFAAILDMVDYLGIINTFKMKYASLFIYSFVHETFINK